MCKCACKTQEHSPPPLSVVTNFKYEIVDVPARNYSTVSKMQACKARMRMRAMGN